MNVIPVSDHKVRVELEVYTPDGEDGPDELRAVEYVRALLEGAFMRGGEDTKTCVVAYRINDGLRETP